MQPFPYHGGVPDEAVTQPELREAAGVAPVDQFLVAGPGGEESSITLAHLRGEAAIKLDGGSQTPAVGQSFWVHFWTTRWRPMHSITIRCSQAGWERDIYGMYRFGGWHFEMPRSTFPSGVTIKFVLDGRSWMDGPDQVLAESANHHFTDDDIVFDPVPTRFIVPYDDFSLDLSRRDQYVLAGDIVGDREYEVIVVGSGMGGGILADQLSDKGIRTLVLEAGGLTLPTHINNLPGNWEALPSRYQVRNFENRDDSQFLFGVQMGLGGRSVFWSGLIPRMRPWEMQAWPSAIQTFLANDGYARAERLMRKRQTLGPFQNRLVEALQQRFGDHEVSDLPRSQHQPNVGPDGLIGDILESPTGTFSTADLLLDSLAYGGSAGRDFLTIGLNQLVRRVQIGGAEEALAVSLDLVGNVERSYKAKYIVLSAGSIESPRLAMQSGLDDPNDKIGRGLTDHPAYFSSPGTDYGYVIPRTLPDGSTHPYGDPTKPAKILLQPKETAASTMPFNVEVLLNGWYWDVRHTDDDLREQILSLNTQARVKFTFVLQSDLDDSNWIALQGDDRPVSLRVAPNRPHRPYHDECKKLRNELLQFFRVPNFDPNQDLAYGNQGTPHHAGGSMRMSDTGTGVVDVNLRMPPYENLYVCDPSVFPSIPAANPSLTLAALALRLADHLASRLGR